MTTIFNNYLTEIEDAIERHRQKESYLTALEYTNRAIGIIIYAHISSIIDSREFELLFRKFADYRIYYTMLLN